LTRLWAEARTRFGTVKPFGGAKARAIQ